MADLKQTPAAQLLTMQNELRAAAKETIERFTRDTEERTQKLLEDLAAAARGQKLLKNPGADGIDELVRKAAIAQVIDFDCPDFLWDGDPVDALVPLTSILIGLQQPKTNHTQVQAILKEEWSGSRPHSHGVLESGKRYRALVFFLLLGDDAGAEE